MNAENIAALATEQINNQSTNIGILIGQATQKADTAIIAAVVAGIAAIAAAIFTAVITGRFNSRISELNRQHEQRIHDINQVHEKRLSEMDKEHQKQWAFIGRRVELIDQAIEVCWRIIFNKLAIVDLSWKPAYENLFALQKEAWVIESKMVVYSSEEVVDAFSDYRSFITALSPNEVRPKWKDIFERGQKCLHLCRQHLGQEVSEKFEDFTNKFNPPSKEEVKAITVNINSLGTLSATTSLFPAKVITENNSSQ